MRILLSNDDGVHSLGLRILYEHLVKVADVWVSAPLEERSTTGHQLTLHKPLRMIQVDKRIFGVSGTPADCVYIGIREVVKRKPDLVISGINRGANLGQDVYYSGTVSAAREACIMGIPAIAVSLAIDFKNRKPDEKLHYKTAVLVVKRLLRAFGKKLEIPKHTLLNVNVPDLPRGKIRGIEFARQGFRHYDGHVVKRNDHRGRPYYWVGGNYRGFRHEEGTDCTLADQGYVTVTPVRLDTTDLSYLAALSGAFRNKQELKI